jgi:hypothetical protein
MNKNIKEISIIGSGIVGCMCAHNLINKGYKVKVFESGSKAGGIMKNINFDNEFFIPGPFFFENEDKLIKEFIKCNRKKLFTKFNLSYGSYSDIISKKPIFLNNFAHPSTDQIFKVSEKKENINTILERVEKYQKVIKLKLKKWLESNFKFYEKMHESCSKIIGIHRIFFINDRKKINQLKRQKYYDDILGIPNNNFKKKIYLIPKNGYDLFFEEYINFLKKKGVEFFFNKKISLKKKEDKLFLVDEKSNIISKNECLIIWTVNPVPLYKIFTNQNFENLVQINKIFFYNLNKIPKSFINKYIHVYSYKYNILRLFFYKINKKIKVTVEFGYTQKKDDELNVQVVKFLAELNKDIKIDLSKRFTYKILKHNLISLSDYIELEKFDKNNLLLINNIIPGSWHEYLRNKKIEKILEKF